MLRRIAAVAVTAAIAGVPAMATAQAAPTSGAAMVLPAACGYPATVFTTTNLRCSRDRVQYPPGNNSVPRGTGLLRVASRESSGHLVRSEVALQVPRLRPGSYGGRAVYAPPSCSQFQRSRSGAVEYRVVKARSDTSAQARDVSRSEKPRVQVTTVTSTGVPAQGEVRVTITKGGYSRTQRVGLRGGVATAFFRAGQPAGSYDVSVTYLGSTNVKRSSATTSFQVG